MRLNYIRFLIVFALLFVSFQFASINALGNIQITTEIDTNKYDTEIIETQATEPRRPITLNWVLMRFIPSVNWTYENTLASNNQTDAALGFRWQLTPISYTFGLNDKLSRFRYFMIDPLSRNSGSIELFFQPEWNDFKSINHKWALNSGLRLYLPISSYGENFSMSLAASNYQISNTNNLKLELGTYTLFGVFGVQFGYIPNPAKISISSDYINQIELPKYNITFSLKYF